MFISILGAIFYNEFSKLLHKSTFSELTCAVIYIKIDRVIEIAISITAITTERDYKSECLFRMCSVVINLVTSLEIKPIRCATTLWHFGRTRNSYGATHFILLSSTAESSAARGYVVVPERFGQNAEPATLNKERTRKKPTFVPSGGVNRFKIKKHVNMSFLHLFYVFQFIFI